MEPRGAKWNPGGPNGAQEAQMEPRRLKSTFNMLWFRWELAAPAYVDVQYVVIVNGSFQPLTEWKYLISFVTDWEEKEKEEEEEEHLQVPNFHLVSSPTLSQHRTGSTTTTTRICN